MALKDASLKLIQIRHISPERLIMEEKAEYQQQKQAKPRKRAEENTEILYSYTIIFYIYQITIF